MNVNWLPNAAAAELAYHPVKIGLTGIVTVVVCKLAPATGVKVKMADVIDRVVSKPTTVTLKPLPLTVAVMAVTVGAAALIRTVRVGTGVGVMFTVVATSCAVIVATPATVPVCTPTLLSVASEPAGMVRVAVRPPVEN